MHRDLSVTVHGVISCVHIFPGAPLPSPFDCGSLKHTIFPTPIIVASQRVIKFDNALRILLLTKTSSVSPCQWSNMLHGWST